VISTDHLKFYQKNLANTWFEKQDWKAYPFQKETWKHIIEGRSGLLNAPTGCGKTYAIWFGIMQAWANGNQISGDSSQVSGDSSQVSGIRSQESGVRNQDKTNNKVPISKSRLNCLWITPLRALSKEIELATKRVTTDLELPYKIALRSGDTSTKERAEQKKNVPQALITTPESVHVLLSQKGYPDYFAGLQFVVVDEWHELMGSKRGVQVELAISRLRALNPNLVVWGISATIGNLEQAKEILLGENNQNSVLVRADINKKTIIETVFPDTLEHFPWAGHLGIKLLDKVVKIINKSNSTLIFTNTRSFAEIWYQKLLSVAPDLAGLIAMHHGSLGEEVRHWVEEALHEGRLKAVVCTSSLDLGVDFQPVDTVIQIGSPKGVARMMQRAGRSGHRPGATSTIFFVPTHSLEIIEGSAIREAIKLKKIEAREPYVRSFDVLIQYLVTLAVSEGFSAPQIYSEIVKTHCFNTVTPQEWAWCLEFLTIGGKSLGAYDEFQKVEIENGIYKVINRKIALRHRFSIGTIVSDSMVKICLMSGKYLGTIEEWFTSKLKPGDTFFFAGMNLEFVRMVDMQAIVRKSNSKKGQIPSYQGGRMPLSSELSNLIRLKVDSYYQLSHGGTEGHGAKYELSHGDTEKHGDVEMNFLKPLFKTQIQRSHLPKKEELLIEKMKSANGYHVFIYPFEGRLVHEGMAAILAYRIGNITQITFSLAMNDYGFELLSDQEIPIEKAISEGILSAKNLTEDVMHSVNGVEIARRRFRDIAQIAGLVFQGYPGKALKTRHLQANSQLFFNVFESYEKENLLLLQAYDEALNFQLEIGRMTAAFNRINTQKIIIKTMDRPSPFCFPILVDGLSRDKFSNENIEDKIQKMIDGE
jgi:ATP-dependent helicase Lhr and Lhr-like helicase